MALALSLPPELAPSLRDRALALVADVGLSAHPEHRRRADVRAGHRCIVCHRGGPLGGHHAADGSVEFVHKGCHRRFHRQRNGWRSA